MKKILKDWTKFEIYFITISILILSICFILTPDKNILSLVISLLGIITVITGAKGLVISPFLNIIYNILYIILSYYQSFYGEVLIYSFILTPINIFTIISWLKNRSKENQNIVKVNKIQTKEYILLSFITILVTTLFYFLLKELNTKSLIISTLSLTDSFVASYLLFRRSSNYAIIFIINDIILISLWLTTTFNNGLAHLPVILSFVIFLINDIYSLIIWKIREKNQK